VSSGKKHERYDERECIIPKFEKRCNMKFWENCKKRCKKRDAWLYKQPIELNPQHYKVKYSRDMMNLTTNRHYMLPFGVYYKGSIDKGN
jgi:hypothetical protein